MVSTSIQPSFGDVIEALRPEDLHLAPSIAYVDDSTKPVGLRALAVDGSPTNAEILAAMKGFYHQNEKLVDSSAGATKNGAINHPKLVTTMNGYDWKDQKLPQERTNTVGSALGLGGGVTTGGIFDDPLEQIKATDLFTTIGVGVSLDVQLFVGGAGGLGAAFDIAKREPITKGYGYATGEIGLRFAAEVNLQLMILNLMPRELDKHIYGLKVSISSGISLSFQVFFCPPGLTILGYAIGAGVGLPGGGATVFGGHIWNFG